MIDRNTDGAVVIGKSIIMMMRNSHQRGKKEEQYKKNCKASVTAQGSSFKHKYRLTFTGQIVNMSFEFVLNFPDT